MRLSPSGRVRAAFRAAFGSSVMVYPATRSAALVVLPPAPRDPRS